MEQPRQFHHTLLMVLICILPLFLFFVLALNGVEISPLFLFLFVIICCGVMFYFMQGAPIHQEVEEMEEAEEGSTSNTTFVGRAEDIFRSRSQHRIKGNVIIEGKLMVDPDTAYKGLRERFENTDNTPLLQEDDAGKPIVVLAPKVSPPTEEKVRSPWLNIVLFGLTLMTTTWAGAAHQGVNLWSQPEKFEVGLPYALALMLILGAHELGHYFAARAHSMRVTLPYFIPVPFALGTFGAFIQLKTPAENRRALFDVGITGPLAGLVFAIPALLIGLQSSTIVPGSDSVSMMQGGASIGSSVLFALIAKLSLGTAVAAGHQVILHPLAFAGWLGLLVTALNLLPIGQLDGGHIAHALFGRKNSKTIGMVALFSLFLLGLFVWSGLLTWAIIVFFIAGTKSASPLNDVSKLDPNRVAIGAFAFILLFLILIPVPHSFYQSLGIHCPYV